MERLKRYRKILIGTGAALAVLAISAGAAAAATEARNRVVSGTTDRSVYEVGQTVTVTGTVNGDVFCAGQTVDIDATVNGDIICAAQTITVNGTVNGNVRLAGQTVNVGAKVSHSASLAAQDANVENNAQIGQDATILAQNANLDGSVGRDIHGTIQSLTLGNNVGRDVDVTVEKLHLGNNANIGGNLSYTSQNRLSRAGGATVSGTIAYHRATAHHRNGHFAWVWRLYIAVALLVLSLILVALWPQVFVRYNKLAAPRAWLALLIGFVAMILAPVLFVGLAITVVGIPLAIMFGLAWLLAIFWSAPLAAYYVGSLVAAKERRAPLVMLVGGAILGVLCLIPIVGFIVTVMAWWFGLGNLLLNLRAGYRKPVYNTK